MFKNYLPVYPPSKKFIIYIAIFFGLILPFILVTHLEFTGHFEGIYLLRGTGGSLLEVKDDLYLNDDYRLLASLDLPNPRSYFRKLFSRHKPGDVYLEYEWDKKDGSGYVRNIMPGGKQMLTCFGRYKDLENGDAYVHGPFVGGGLPAEVKGDDVEKMNQTGMAYFDGRRWYHVWCTANEVIDSAYVMEQLYPSQWEYMGSKVVHASDHGLIIRSEHKALLNGVPLRMERYVSFKAGETYFILSVKITNIGDTKTGIYFSYGDEPWLGNYGSSKGNVGWVKDFLIEHNFWVDTQKYSYAGYFDYGNDLIGEGHNFTMTADFIEWFGKDRPDVYFSNSPNDYPAVNDMTPLQSNARFMTLKWGPEFLQPGKSVKHVMAIGMAGHDPKTGFPVKPDTTIEGQP